MIQRIAVRLVLEHKGKPLIVRRADGRSSILGKYELPGGRVYGGEQPEDALVRYLHSDLGIQHKVFFELDDVLTYMDADDRGIQYAVVVYKGAVVDPMRSITLSQHYDKYIWYQSSKVAVDKLTELTQYILGIYQPKNTSSQQGGPQEEYVNPLPLVYSDGGSRGNPGPSAAGFVLVSRGGEVVCQGGEFLGVMTNNQAEYQGLILGLKAALSRGWRSVECRSDSMLVVKQLKGVYKVTGDDLLGVHAQAMKLINQFEKVKLVHIPRELNTLADGMVNRVLNEQAGMV